MKITKEQLKSQIRELVKEQLSYQERSMTKTELKEHIRKIVRECLNESNPWRDEAAGRGIGGGSWRDNYPRGGDDEYPQRRRRSRYGESDEERLDRQSREMQDEEKNKMLKQLKLNPSLKNDQTWRQDFFNAGGWWDDLGMDAP